MDLLSKDKLARLDEERQQRRKARADEAIKRLDEVGKKTQLTVAAHVESGGTPTAKPGGLSRVLFEHATGADQHHDGRTTRRTRRQDANGVSAIQTEGHRALGTIDHAMSSIHSAMMDATGAGMRHGFEGAARSVSDAVQRVSTLANGAPDGHNSASNNPLAELMATEAAEHEADHKEDRETGRLEPHGANHGGVDQELGHLVKDVLGTGTGAGPDPKLGHEVRPEGGGDPLTVPRQLGQSLASSRDDVGATDGKGPRDAASNVVANILGAPRELAHNAVNAPRDALERAADGPHQIAQNLRDAPAHAIENVTQVAGHVERNHKLGLGAIGTLVDAGRDPTGTMSGASSLREVGQHAQNAQTAQIAPRAAQAAGQSVDQVRQNLDPTRLASQAANTFAPRHIVEEAVNLGGVRDLGQRLDPRAVAERTTAGVDPRNLLRGSVDPSRVLEGKTAVPHAGADASAPKSATPSVGAKPDAKIDAKTDTKIDAKTPSGLAETKGPANAQAPQAAGPAAVHAAYVEHARGDIPAHAIAGGRSGAIEKPAPAHSSVVVRPRGPAEGAAPTPPTPGPGTPARSMVPARERQTPASHIQPSRDRTVADVTAGGQTTITPQPVVDAAPPELDRTQSPIQQPAFTIEMRGEGSALPALHPTPLPPKINQPPVSQASPPAAANVHTTSTREVAPLASAPPTATSPRNPALDAGRTAIADVTVPKGTIAPLPPSHTSVAPGGSVVTSWAAAHPGAGGIKTAAQAPQTPIITPVPSPSLGATPSAPKTPTPALVTPVIPALRRPIDGHVPDPSSLVQGNVSLTPDRTTTSQAIHTEAQSQSDVGPNAQLQRESLIVPLRPQMETIGRSTDAPMASAGMLSLKHGEGAVASARERAAQEAATGRQQVGTQLQGASAERAQFAAMPPPSILQQTSPAAMQPVIGAGQAAVQSTASAVGASPVQIDPAVVARGTAAGAVPSMMPPFDAARFEGIDRHAPVPALSTASIDAAHDAAGQSYRLATQQIQNLPNIPPPIINVPVTPNAQKLTSGGQPTREAAIARIEREVAEQANAQAPGQMRTASERVQQQLLAHVATSEQAARAQAASEVGSAQTQAHEIGAKAPPITGAQAAARAQPEYAAHQAAASTAHDEMQAQITAAHGTAETTTSAARTLRDQQIQTAQATYQNDVQGHVPHYAAQQATANAEFQAQNQTAQQSMAAEQSQAEVRARAEADQAKAKADSDVASHQSQLEQQRQEAVASHVQQAQHATQQHEAAMRQQQSQMDAQVQQQQSEMHSQVAVAQSQGQREVDQHLAEGEAGYRAQIQQGEQHANVEKHKAEHEAAGKQAQADDEKKKHSGGLFGGVVGWVKDRVSDLMNAVKAVLSAARDMVVSLMEKARQAAMAVLEKARQAAIAAMQKAKSAVQGVIAACASAVRSVINAVANQIKSLIHGLATVLKGLVSALTSMLGALVTAYQAAMNAVMSGLVAAVGLVNKDLGDKLRSSTQKYRDSFNNAMTGLKSNIDAAGTALQAGIQRSAEGAIASVDSAQQALDDSVLRAEQTMNTSVDSAYKHGVTAINQSFDAAEITVNKAFDVSETGVKSYFDLQIGAVSVVQKGIDAVADFAIEAADHVMATIDNIAQAVVSMIPDSWKKAFVDFWNGPWRSTIIIGLATVAAVAITAGTLGAGAPVAAVLMASVLGGSIAGTAYFGGELASRESDIALSSKSKGMYVTGFGDVQIGKDGKPIPPQGLTPDKRQQFDKQTQTSMSNFDLKHDQNGQVSGYERKAGSEITDAATQEGIKGFGEGAISSGLAATGGALGGAAVKGIGLAAESTMSAAVEGGVSNVITGPVQNALTGAFDTGFAAMKHGKSPVEAFQSAFAAGRSAVANPRDWAAAMLTLGVTPLKLKFITNPVEHAVEGSMSKVGTEVVSRGAELVTDTMTMTLGAVGGAYIGAYSTGKKQGMTDAQARAAGATAASKEFSPETIIATLTSNTASSFATHFVPEHGAPHSGAEHPAPQEGAQKPAAPAAPPAPPAG